MRCVYALTRIQNYLQIYNYFFTKRIKNSKYFEKQREADLLPSSNVPRTRLELAQPKAVTTPSKWRVYQFHHLGLGLQI